jgi:hypothetical protein
MCTGTLPNNALLSAQKAFIAEVFPLPGQPWQQMPSVCGIPNSLCVLSIPLERRADVAQLGLAREVLVVENLVVRVIDHDVVERRRVIV